jgi:hypothetical protein
MLPTSPDPPENDAHRPRSRWPDRVWFIVEILGGARFIAGILGGMAGSWVGCVVFLLARMGYDYLVGFWPPDYDYAGGYFACSGAALGACIGVWFGLSLAARLKLG